MSEDCLSTTQLRRCVSEALPKGAAIEIKDGPPVRGTINDIYRFDADGETYCLRVRSRQSLLTYSSVLKEPVAGLLLSRPAGTLEEIDIAYANAIDVIKGQIKGRGDNFDAALGLVFFDMSREALPYDWQCLRWLPGTPLDAGSDPARYAHLGATLGRFHRKFASPPEAIADSRSGIKWLGEAIKEIKEKTGRNGLSLNFDSLLRGHENWVCQVSLLHNDVHPLNVVGGQGVEHLIDWDNMVIGPCALDLLKLKYWTAREDDADARYESNRALYSSFRHAYETIQNCPDPNLERFCEVLWLTRILDFESARVRRDGKPPVAPMLEPEIYRSAIYELKLAHLF